MISQRKTVQPFNFSSLVDQIDRKNLIQEILDIEDPSKVIYTLTKGLLIMLDSASKGIISLKKDEWSEIK
jgi:hypothetical protein